MGLSPALPVLELSDLPLPLLPVSEPACSTPVSTSPAHHPSCCRFPFVIKILVEIGSEPWGDTLCSVLTTEIVCQSQVKESLYILIFFGTLLFYVTNIQLPLFVPQGCV